VVYGADFVQRGVLKESPDSRALTLGVTEKPGVGSGSKSTASEVQQESIPCGDHQKNVHSQARASQDSPYQGTARLFRSIFTLIAPPSSPSRPPSLG
jgi:hypothetical protein